MLMPSKTRKIPFAQHPITCDRAAIPLHAMIINAGHEKRTPPEQYDFDGRSRGPAEWVLLQHTLAGRGELEYENTRHVLTPGSTMLLCLPHPPPTHRYWRDKKNTWRFMYVCLTGHEAVRAIRHTIARLSPVLHEPDRLEPAIADIVRDAIAGNLNDPHTNSTRAYALAMSILAIANETNTDTATNAMPPEVAAAIDLARRRFADPIGVDDMAFAAALSRYHFSRLFKHHTGQPPGEFLRRQRLRVATGLLQSTDLPLKAIAMKCGFPNADYLARCFRKAHGVSPNAFRHASLR